MENFKYPLNITGGKLYLHKLLTASDMREDFQLFFTIIIRFSQNQKWKIIF